MIKEILKRDLHKGNRKVLLQILWQWLGLIAQIIIVGIVARTIALATVGQLEMKKLLIFGGVALFAMLSKAAFDALYTEAVLTVSEKGKKDLREKSFSKIRKLGNSFGLKVSKNELAYILTDGADSLELYYGLYYSQFVYAIIAPLTLFFFLMRYNLKAALVLLAVVPLAPVLDIAGAAVGIAAAVSEFLLNNLTLEEGIIFLLLSFEFYKPMKLLSEYYEVGKGRRNAAAKIFSFFDIKSKGQGNTKLLAGPYEIVIQEVSFTVEGEKVLPDTSMQLHPGQIMMFSEHNDLGTSVLAGILRRQYKGYEGSIYINGSELRTINEASLMEVFTFVTPESYMFEGTVKDNLLVGCKKASDKRLHSALKVMNLEDEVPLGSDAANLNVKQIRLVLLARALLKNSPVYVLQDITAGLDGDEADAIMKLIEKLSKDFGKTILLIKTKGGAADE